MEFSERVRHRVGGFVLLRDALNGDTGRAFPGSEGLVLSRPIDETELYRICRTVEERTTLIAGD